MNQDMLNGLQGVRYSNITSSTVPNLIVELMGQVRTLTYIVGVCAAALISILIVQLVANRAKAK